MRSEAHAVRLYSAMRRTHAPSIVAIIQIKKNQRSDSYMRSMSCSLVLIFGVRELATLGLTAKQPQ
jgi:hypothetical protein